MNTTKLQAIDRLLSEIRRGIHCTRQKGEPDRDYTAPNLPYPNTVADIQVPICLQASMVADHRCRRLEKFEGLRVVLAFDIPGCGRSGPCVLVRQWTGARSADQAFGELCCSSLLRKSLRRTGITDTKVLFRLPEPACLDFTFYAISRVHLQVRYLAIEYSFRIPICNKLIWILEEYQILV